MVAKAGTVDIWVFPFERKIWKRKALQPSCLLCPLLPSARVPTRARNANDKRSAVATPGNQGAGRLDSLCAYRGANLTTTDYFSNGYRPTHHIDFDTRISSGWPARIVLHPPREIQSIYGGWCLRLWTCWVPGLCLEHDSPHVRASCQPLFLFSLSSFLKLE